MPTSSNIPQSQASQKKEGDEDKSSYLMPVILGIFIGLGVFVVYKLKKSGALPSFQPPNVSGAIEQLSDENIKQALKTATENICSLTDKLNSKIIEIYEVKADLARFTAPMSLNDKLATLKEEAHKIYDTLNSAIEKFQVEFKNQVANIESLPEDHFFKRALSTLGRFKEIE